LYYLGKNENISKEWLKVNREPESVIFHHLENTLQIRKNDSNQKNLNQFLNEWPIFKSEKGHFYVRMLFELKIYEIQNLKQVDYDFALRYPSSYKFEEKFMKMVPELIKKANEKLISTKRPSKRFEELQKDESTFLKLIFI
jgi:hypothetical protein